MAGPGIVVVRSMPRGMVGLVVGFMKADLLFLLWGSWCEKGLRKRLKTTIFLQFWGKKNKKN